MNTADFIEFLVDKNGVAYVLTVFADGLSKLADKRKEQGNEYASRVYRNASTELYIARNEIERQEIEYRKAQK